MMKTRMMDEDKNKMAFRKEFVMLYNNISGVVTLKK